MKLLVTSIRNAPTLATLVWALGLATIPVAAGENMNPKYVSQILYDSSIGHEDGASAAAIERQIKAEIIRRFRQRADNGDTDAMTVLGHVYEMGRGVPQDFVAAYKWYGRAAAYGDSSAALLRDAVASRMNADQLATAQSFSRGLSPRQEPEIETADRSSGSQ